MATEPEGSPTLHNAGCALDPRPGPGQRTSRSVGAEVDSRCRPPSGAPNTRLKITRPCSHNYPDPRRDHSLETASTRHDLWSETSNPTDPKRPDQHLYPSGRRDLNPRPQRPERCALPSCATSRAPDVTRRRPPSDSLPGTPSAGGGCRPGRCRRPTASGWPGPGGSSRGA